MHCPHKWCRLLSIGFGICLVILKKIFSRRSQYNLKTFPETLRIKRREEGEVLTTHTYFSNSPPSYNLLSLFSPKTKFCSRSSWEKKGKSWGKWDWLQKETKFIGICESRVHRGPGGLDPSSWVITITCYNHRVCQSQHCTLLSIDTIVQCTTCARQLFALISVSCHKHWPTALYWRMI